MKKRQFNKLIKKDPVKAIDYLSSCFKKYKLQHLDSILDNMKLQPYLKLKIKDFFINTASFRSFYYSKENWGFLKIMFSILLNLKSSYPVNNNSKVNYKIEPKFGGGDVFKDRRKPINRQASKGAKSS